MNFQTPREITLSHKALYELKAVLEKDIGYEALVEMSEDDINEFGVFVLTLAGTVLKRQMREQEVE